MYYFSVLLSFLLCKKRIKFGMDLKTQIIHFGETFLQKKNIDFDKSIKKEINPITVTSRYIGCVFVK